MKRKVLIVGGFPSPQKEVFGGIVTSCQSLVSSSFSDHYDLVLIDSTQISNPPPPLSVRGFLALKRFFVFLSQYFIEKPDAVILFTAVGASIVEKGALAWLARARRIPIFMFPRGAGVIKTAGDSAFQRLWVTLAMRGATHLLCQGPAWQDFATEVLGFPANRCPIIPNWTATERLLSIGTSRVVDVTSAAPIFLFVGWLEKEKGIIELLEASLSVSKHFDFYLMIAGRGHAEQEARMFVQANGLERVVRFCGWVEGGAKEELLRRADILILPSWAEGFPNAVVEAMAAKLAVIVTAVGNIPDLLVNEEHALVVQPKSVGTLAEAMCRLLLDPQLRLKLADRAHSFARDTFSVGQGVAALTRVIDDAIEMSSKRD